MRRILLLLAFAGILQAAQAQTMDIYNASACDIQYTVTAMDPTCAASTVSVNMFIAAGTSVTLNLSTVAWTGPIAGGWVWGSFMGRNFCGPWLWPNNDCLNQNMANTNLVMVGEDCLGFTYRNCSKMDNTCNNGSCSYIRVDWIHLGGGNIQVDIG